MAQPVKFIKCTQSQLPEAWEREERKLLQLEGMYIGQTSGAIYFVVDYEREIDFSNNKWYNNYENKIIPLKEEVESNPFLEGVQFESSFENMN